ncbi:hypothetical protein HIM_04832 [Hirsutella minnesotensis 3608]|uniref:Uncharacterized protein n=1 Tax=Hirsutella minnesotensis 3608 TaxID=1043627 RepID=A0A0F7ZPK8_9HYPO|nr:hypothetical protein HIM_04832 [Hirsutella minnesotensis 3608]
MASFLASSSNRSLSTLLVSTSSLPYAQSPQPRASFRIQYSRWGKLIPTPERLAWKLAESSIAAIADSGIPLPTTPEPPTDRGCSLVDAKNKVPEHQRYYQQAYKAHTRLWMIGSRSRWYMTPYLVILWGGFGAAMYSIGRKVTGHNSWVGKD